MKGLVLAGGKGSRLRPFTYTGAKQLVPIANRPVIFYAIEQLVEVGIRDIGVIVGEMAEQVQQALGDGNRFGARLTYLYQSQPLGVAHAIIVARDFLGDSPFVMVLGDNFLREGIGDIVTDFRKARADCQIVLRHVSNPQDFGVAIIDGDRLQRVVEKPPVHVSSLAIIGIYLFTEQVHDAVASITPSHRGELEITDTIQWFIDHGRTVHYSVYSGYWIDTGRMGDILAANRAILEVQEGRVDGEVDDESELHGSVTIERGARVQASRIDGPAIIGNDTVIEHSYIGPFTSIDHDCMISDSEIAGSVVLEHTRILHVERRIEGSLIGRRVHLEGSTRRPRSFRLILGDFSEAKLP